MMIDLGGASVRSEYDAAVYIGGGVGVVIIFLVFCFVFFLQACGSAGRGVFYSRRR